MSTTKRNPIICNSYGSRKGCGQEIYLVEDAKYSTPRQKKWKRCQLVKIPTFDDQGNMEFRWVEHAFFCENQTKLQDYTEKQLRKQAEFRATRNPKDSSSVSRVDPRDSLPKKPFDRDDDIPF